MKILHCADIHLGSKIESKFSNDKSNIRKREVLNTFSRMIDYANENQINVVILAGDVFDKDKPSIKDKEYFYRAIKSNPQIDFLYLNGNHDQEGSYVEFDIPNLKRFDKENFVSYEYGNICISGIEMTEYNATSFYSKLNLDKSKINIVVLHGDATDSMGMDKIKIDSLKNKGIDYLALGHIHSYKSGRIDDRGVYAFPGCLEGRGFDECGEKGFIVLSVEDTVNYKFVPFAKRTLVDLDINVTSANDLFDVIELVKNNTLDIAKDNILRINLIGELPVGIDVVEEDVKTALSDYFFVDVKNKTSLKIDINKYDDDKSLIGVFVRTIYENENYSQEEKQELITMGLRAISGKEVD